MPLDNDDDLSAQQTRIVNALAESRRGWETKQTLASTLGIEPATAKRHIEESRKKGIAIPFDRSLGEHGGYYLDEGETAVRRLATKHKGTITRELNEFAVEQESAALRYLERFKPIRAAQTTEAGGIDACLAIADIHYGDSVERETWDGTVVEFDGDVADNDFRYAVAEFLRRYQHDERVDNVHLFALGDFVTGSDVYKGQSFYIKETVDEQTSMAANALRDAVITLADAFGDDVTVNVWAIPGNHGRAGYDKSPKANFDRLAYLWAKGMVAEHGRDDVSWVDTEAVQFLNATVRGGEHRILMRHGQDGQAHVDKTARSQADWRGWRDRHRFDAALRGHWHNYSYDKVLNTYPVVTLPSAKPGSEFAERIGMPDCSVMRDIAVTFESTDTHAMRRVEVIDDSGTRDYLERVGALDDAQESGV